MSFEVLTSAPPPGGGMARQVQLRKSFGGRSNYKELNSRKRETRSGGWYAEEIVDQESRCGEEGPLGFQEGFYR
ncbi:MAG: hypothetical protein ACRD3E_20555 [Terriglobales bacterium]